jgi:PKD repeat protein
MSYHSEVLTDAPVAWYKLGEASSDTAFDFMDGAHNGAYVGSPTRNQPGLVPGNTAVKFTGSNYMRVPHDTWMDTSTWSIEMLVKLDSLTSDFAQTAIVTRHGSAGGIWDLLLNNGKVQFRLAQAGFPTAESTTSLVVGQKYHLVGTYDGTQIKLYVNGVLEATTAATSGNVGSTQAMTVAKFADGYDFGYLSGTVDEVACYGTALPAARIAVHSAAAGLGSAPPANVAPTAHFTMTATNLAVHLDASASTDDGSIASYHWDFGDGATATGQVVDHTFPSAGTWYVALTVTDNQGATGYIDDYAVVTAGGGGGGGGGGDVPGGDDITLTGTSGTFAIDFAATNPVTIHYTPAFDGSLTIQATSPADWEPLWAVYDSDGDEIQDDTGDLGLVWVSRRAPPPDGGAQRRLLRPAHRVHLVLCGTRIICADDLPGVRLRGGDAGRPAWSTSPTAAPARPSPSP